MASTLNRKHTGSEPAQIERVICGIGGLGSSGKFRGATKTWRPAGLYAAAARHFTGMPLAWSAQHHSETSNPAAMHDYKRGNVRRDTIGAEVEKAWQASGTPLAAQ
ncbi:hypothetical protein [Beijerinckia sp. L45]|uniref:hypothetical protein n=1 Tax=Beijerinckia sp. L45 TaxID=1641855 RepID=UPI00131A84A1|nr:hypothetical protein [Beijerinckia sp. L45]